MQAWYPIDAAEYKSKINKDNVAWPRHGIKMIRGMLSQPQASGLAWLSPIVLFKHLLAVKMDVVVGGQLAEEFRKGGKKLIPIVFSHGVRSNGSVYSMMLKEWASYGYLVLAINHLDDTCLHTV